MQRNERGQVSVVLIGMLVAGLLVVGLAFDGTRLLLARRDAAAVADAAALAGASAIDAGAFRDSDGAVVTLDRDVAAREAHRIEGAEDASVAMEGERVAVHIDVPVDMVLLRFLGVQHVGATAVATPRVH